MSRDRTTRRPAYTLVVVLLTTFLVLGFATVMGGMVVLEWSRARQRTLEAQAARVVASAQAWSRVHAAELATGQPVVLPVEDLLVPGTSGSATLRPARGEAGGLVECELSVARAGRRLVRVVTWAVAAP